MNRTATMSRVNEESSDNDRYEWVDILRFVASMAVFVQHAFENSASPVMRWIPHALSPGVFGVVLFFLISGFVMPLSVRGHFNMVKFALRRVFRIFPGVLFAFTLLLIVPFFVPPYHSSELWGAGWRTWIANLLLIQDYVGEPAFLGVTWTLSLEFAWYALFAVCWAWRKGDSIDFLCKTATALMLLVAVASILIGHRAPLGRLGMIYAAIIGAQSYFWVIGRISLRTLLSWIFVFILVMSISNIVSFGYYRHSTIPFSQSFWPWIFAPALFFSTVVFMRSRKNGRVGAVMSYVGKTSFSIYLLHPIALNTMGWIDGDALRIGAALVVTVCASYLAYRFVELPGVMAGRRLAMRLSRSA